MKKEQSLYPFAAGDNDDSDDFLTIKITCTRKFPNVPLTSSLRTQAWCSFMN